MKKTAIIVLSVLFATIFTGCGQKSSPTENVQNPADQLLSPPAVAHPVVNPKPENPVDKEAPEVPVKKNYVMTENFTIVPKETDGNKKIVLLTFDDGPKEKEQVEKMLDILDKHEAKAIFFVNGYRVKQNPELLKMIHDRGQIIGNHSWDHIILKKEPRETIQRQMGDVQKIVEGLTGEKPVFFRPPNGAYNDEVKAVAKEQNLLMMTWSNGSLDWDKRYFKPEAVIDNVLKQLHPGSNILMHELPWTIEALDSLLNKIKENGYGFVDPRAIETTNP